MWRALLGCFFGKAGNREEAEKILDDFLNQSKNAYFSPYLIAKVYAGLDNNDKVFEYLDRSYQIQDPNQIIIKYDFAFSDLHSDPRWQDVLKKRNLAE